MNALNIQVNRNIQAGHDCAAGRRGLTLMELVVVMVILIALAGMLLPLFPNMLNRAHTTTSATSNVELSKAIMTYQGLYYAYPNRLDNLATGSGTLFTMLPGSGSDAGAYATGAQTPAGVLTQAGNLTAAQLTAGTLAALNSVGITNVAQVVEAAGNSTGNWSPTFFPYAAVPSSVNSTALAAGTPVATLGYQAIQNMGLSWNGATGTGAYPTYVVLGAGDYSTMSGKTMDEAPVHFDDDPNYNPNNAYGRFGVLFQVTDVNGTALPQAIYAGAVSFHPVSDGGAVGTDAHIQEYFSNISTNQ